MARPKSIDIKNVRVNSNENQSEFWERFGITQSGGSRYESGRNIPAPVKLLIGLWLGNIIDDEQLGRARKQFP
jgi:hypothetical protein